MSDTECGQNQTVKDQGKDHETDQINQREKMEDKQSSVDQGLRDSSSQHQSVASPAPGHSECAGSDRNTVLMDRLDISAASEDEEEDSDGSYHSLTNQEAEELLREVEDDTRDAFQADRPEDTSLEKEGEKPEEESLAYDFPADGEEGACSADDEDEKEKEKEKARQKEEEALTGEEKEDRKQRSQKLKDEGNQLFRQGSYQEAITLYTQALELCPLVYKKEQAVMFANRAACKMKEEKNESAIKDCTKAVDLHPEYLKAIARRAELYERTEKLDDALKDHTRVLELDPGQHASRAACLRLDEAIKERNEKLKNEMLGKLKDLGNMVLRPFGLSTNNFKLQQDPNSGGYSVQFVQSPPTNGN